jgi:hypothetical protein
VSCVAKMALASMTIHTHGDKHVKLLETAVVDRPKLDLQKTLEAFKNG